MFIQEMELHSFGGQQHSSEILRKRNVHWHIASKDQDSRVVVFVRRSFKGTGRRGVHFLSPLPLYCSHRFFLYFSLFNHILRNELRQQFFFTNLVLFNRYEAITSVHMT
jgi:hypothetical protein